MTKLNINPNMPNPDDFYAKLINCHHGLTKEQSDSLNARLILILANHIGDQEVIEEAMALAMKDN
ncbi:MAG: DUF2783 domain-containing protein [Rhizobiaceae bacterium]|nr:DUF2783 domain-containing protein [Rhizobiaceae bacterium]